MSDPSTVNPELARLQSRADSAKDKLASANAAGVAATEIDKLRRRCELAAQSLARYEAAIAQLRRLFPTADAEAILGEIVTTLRGSRDDSLPPTVGETRPDQIARALREFFTEFDGDGAPIDAEGRTRLFLMAFAGCTIECPAPAEIADYLRRQEIEASYRRDSSKANRQRLSDFHGISRKEVLHLSRPARQKANAA